MAKGLTSSLFFMVLVSISSAAVKLQEIFSWNALDWAYPNEESRLAAFNSGEFIPQNALPVGIERWNNKLFVSVPRWRPGIPATLNYINLDSPYNPSPKLIPYPSWQANELGNCASGLTTVYRIKADKCDRLWVLDVGTYGYDPNVTNVCPYSINVFDLRTDQRIRRYVFRPEDIVPTTFIANTALDIGNGCDDTFAYFSDELGYGLIVYSWEQNRSWRFEHDFFRPDPLRGDYHIGGLNFQWGTEGIFGITTSAIGSDGYRQLYFSPLSSNTQFAVSTRVLRNESAVTGSYYDFKIVGDRGENGHTTAHAASETGIHLFNLIDQNAIGCWNSALPHKPQNIAVVDKDDNGLLFPCDVKIVNENEVWVISDKMSQFLESEFGLDYSDINFRIFTAPLDKLIAGTACEPTTYLSPHSYVPSGAMLQTPLRSPFQTPLQSPVRPSLQSPLRTPLRSPLQTHSRFFDPRLSTAPQLLTQALPRNLQTQAQQFPQAHAQQFPDTGLPEYGDPQLQFPQVNTLQLRPQAQRTFSNPQGISFSQREPSISTYPPHASMPVKIGRPSRLPSKSTWWMKNNDNYQVYE